MSNSMQNKITEGINVPLFYITGGFIFLFCLFALVNLEGLSTLINTSSGLSF